MTSFSCLQRLVGEYAKIGNSTRTLLDLRRRYNVHIAQATDGNSTPEDTRPVAVVKHESDSDLGQAWPDEQSEVTVQSEDSGSEGSDTIDEVSDREDDSLSRLPNKNVELSVSAPAQHLPELSVRFSLSVLFLCLYSAPKFSTACMFDFT